MWLSPRQIFVSVLTEIDGARCASTCRIIEITSVSKNRHLKPPMGMYQQIVGLVKLTSTLVLEGTLLNYNLVTMADCRVRTEVTTDRDLIFQW